MTLCTARLKLHDEGPQIKTGHFPETSRNRRDEATFMKPLSSFCAIVGLIATLPTLALGQTPGASTSTSSTTTDSGATNPLLGGTGTYGTAAQGSTTGGGAYSIPNPNGAAIDETFRRLDRNGDSVLSMEEFRSAYAKPVGADSGAKARKQGSSRHSR